MLVDGFRVFGFLRFMALGLVDFRVFRGRVLRFGASDTARSRR